MTPCTSPKEIGDLRYVNGRDCTWHGLIGKADERRNGRPCCPHCGGELIEHSSPADFESFLAVSPPGIAEVLRWGAGKCFPDFDTLQNAYRQAMEGQS